MSSGPFSASLRYAVEAARLHEAPFRDHAGEPPPKPGAWSPLDNLAHLTAWREVAADTLEAAREGKPLPPLPNIDEYNQAQRERDSVKPADQVLAEADGSWERLLAALEPLDDAALRALRPGATHRPLWEIIPGNTFEHLAEHLAYFHRDHDRAEEADQAMEWGCATALQIAGEPGLHANAYYNLACYHARLRDAERAAKLLRQGLALRPELRDWAQKDRDLDAVREHPAVSAVLQPD